MVTMCSSDMSVECIANGSCAIVEVKSVLPQSSPDVKNQKPDIQPPTPDSKRENAEEVDKCGSPLSMICSDSTESCDSLMGDYPRTPEENVFDPFAPGPDKFMLAPLRRKHTDEARTSAARRLNFSSAAVKLNLEVVDKSELEKASDENDLFESLYNIILDAIVSEQSQEQRVVLSPEECAAPKCAPGLSWVAETFPGAAMETVLDSEECATPKSAPRLSWIAETCPGAPMKTSRKSRNIDLDLCRKLEY